MTTTADRAPAPPDRGCVACIGVFDGVHRGHQALLALARLRSRAAGLPLVAVTFDPHPLSVVRPESAPTTLATIEHRVELLHAAGADVVDVLAFDASLAATAPADFVQEILLDRIGVREIVVGENFRFGHRAAGTVDTLRDAGRRLGFSVTPVPLVGDGAERWSSTLTRSLITTGDVAAGADALGRPYRLEGVVVHGDHRGRELGFPTANLAWAGNPTIPEDGVYAGWVGIDGEPLPAAISIGTNPQFGGRVQRVESYVLDRDDLDLYDRQIRVEFAHRIRGQERFADVSALVDRMAVDVSEARVLLGTGA
ncbi:MAG: bifunctional riboflavin kinase/FAD synthetase [Actinobacteria bacterium]|nr:bifunctional riboflavin kinase/FAD synthetase [Actinomycetota bacterium]